MARRLLTLWLFPLCLLTAQAGGMVHGFGHVATGGPSKDRAGTGDVCVQCIGFAKMNHVAVDTASDRVPESVGAAIGHEAHYVFQPVAAATFQPRGPPRRL